MTASSISQLLLQTSWMRKASEEHFERAMTAAGELDFLLSSLADAKSTAASSNLHTPRIGLATSSSSSSKARYSAQSFVGASASFRRGSVTVESSDSVRSSTDAHEEKGEAKQSELGLLLWTLQRVGGVDDDAFLCGRHPTSSRPSKVAVERSKVGALRAAILSASFASLQYLSSVAHSVSSVLPLQLPSVASLTPTQIYLIWHALPQHLITVFGHALLAVPPAQRASSSSDSVVIQSCDCSRCRCDNPSKNDFELVIADHLGVLNHSAHSLRSTVDGESPSASGSSSTPERASTQSSSSSCRLSPDSFCEGPEQSVNVAVHGSLGSLARAMSGDRLLLPPALLLTWWRFLCGRNIVQFHRDVQHLVRTSAQSILSKTPDAACLLGVAALLLDSAASKGHDENGWRACYCLEQRRGSGLIPECASCFRQRLLREAADLVTSHGVEAALRLQGSGKGWISSRGTKAATFAYLVRAALRLRLRAPQRTAEGTEALPSDALDDIKSATQCEEGAKIYAGEPVTMDNLACVHQLVLDYSSSLFVAGRSEWEHATLFGEATVDGAGSFLLDENEKKSAIKPTSATLLHNLHHQVGWDSSKNGENNKDWIKCLGDKVLPFQAMEHKAHELSLQFKCTLIEDPFSKPSNALDLMFAKPIENGFPTETCFTIPSRAALSLFSNPIQALTSASSGFRRIQGQQQKSSEHVRTSTCASSPSSVEPPVVTPKPSPLKRPTSAPIRRPTKECAVETPRQSSSPVVTPRPTPAAAETSTHSSSRGPDSLPQPPTLTSFGVDAGGRRVSSKAATQSLCASAAVLHLLAAIVISKNKAQTGPKHPRERSASSLRKPSSRPQSATVRRPVPISPRSTAADHNAAADTKAATNTTTNKPIRFVPKRPSSAAIDGSRAATPSLPTERTLSGSVTSRGKWEQKQQTIQESASGSSPRQRPTSAPVARRSPSSTSPGAVDSPQRTVKEMSPRPVVEETRAAASNPSDRPLSARSRPPLHSQPPAAAAIVPERRASSALGRLKKSANSFSGRGGGGGTVPATSLGRRDSTTLSSLFFDDDDDDDEGDEQWEEVLFAANKN